MKYVVIPFPGHTFEQMFSQWSPFFRENICERSPYMLKKSFAAINIELCPPTVENMMCCDAVLHYEKIDCSALKMFPQKHHFYVALEPNIVRMINSKSKLKELSKYVYDAVVTTHEGVEGDRIYPIIFPRDFPASIVAKNDTDFTEKKLACMFAGNKYALGKSEQYSVRRKIIAYFEKYAPDNFDLYGYGWSDLDKKLKVYRGSVDDKLEVSSHYKFAFCLENEKFIKANISEKIFDAMIAGTVPIYEGIDDIEDFVPANCFIRFSDFNSIEDCVQYLKSMTEEEYMQYKKNIEQYILSEETRSKFSAKNMRDQIVRAYQERTTPKKHRALWLLDLYMIEQKVYNGLCRLQKNFEMIKWRFGQY